MSEQGATIAGLKLANAFVLTTRGVPQLYYGDELGMTGPDEPTARADFPGGFPGDKKNAFTKEGRSAEEQRLFEYVRKAARLHTELDPLKRGELINLQVSDQQYAYARRTRTAVVVALINNDTKAANFEFKASPAGLVDGTSLVDRLGSLGDVRISGGSLKASLPARSAAVLVPR
jgi:glycosidase